MFTLHDLLEADRRPAPYEPGEELWNDPHISKMMLQAHLSPETDAASYKPETRRAILEHLICALKLAPGCALVDLGCGPGLYCAELSGKGFRVTGIDRSESSVCYAKNRDPRGEYIRASYLEPFGTARFEAALMISQDYGVLSPENRKTLLRNIRDALKPGGRFAFDVASMAAYREKERCAAPKWYADEGGFWRPHGHFVLEKAFFYAEIPAACDVYAVFDADGVKTYRIHQTYFSPESIRAELAENGFETVEVLFGLDGTPYRDDSPLIGVICRRS